MYDQQPNKIKPPQFDDDIDDFMAKRKPSALKPAQPADDDVDSFMSKRQPAPKSPASTYPSSPSAPIVNTAPKMLPTYDEWRKSGATDAPDSFRPDLSHWQNAKMPDANGQMQDYPARELDPGPNDGAMHDTWFDANKPYKSETVTYKPKGVAPIARAVDPRARQAAQISRQINQQRDEATRLFKQADATQLERTGGNFSNVEALRAQAEGKLAAANELARRAQKTHGDLLEVGFGKDTDPNSRREWAYAKPRAPKAMEESDALAIQSGNNQRFADPNGLNQALNVTPEAKARFDHQRKIEGIQQSSYPGLDPVARFGSRVWQGLKGESGADVAEAYPPVLPGEEDVNRVIQSGVKGVGSMVRGGATALPYAFPIVDAMSKGLTGRPLRSYTEGLGRPMESAIGRGAEAILPENPANQSFLAKTERGLGSMAPAMGGAIATGGGSLAAGALGALTNLGQVATERDQSKVPVSDLRRVSSDALAIATGMTEALGMGKLLNRMGLSTPLVHRLAQMVEEGGQEYAQDYLNDINAKLVAAYDPQRQINDPLAAKRLESAAIGAILGFGGEVADYAGGKLQNQIAAPSIRAERAPMQDIRPTMTGPTQVTPLTPKPTRTAAAETATPVSAIDQTVPKSTIDQTEPQIAAESPSAFPRLPEPEGFNARRAQMLGMELPAEVSINERLQKADKLASSQNENDQKLGKRMLKQTLADIQKSEGYLTEFDLPDDGPKPYTAVKNAIEARLPRKLSDSQNLNAEVPLNEQAASPAIPSSSPQNDTGQRLIEQTRLKADQAIAEGRFDDAVSELKAHQQALKDAKTAARKSPGMRTQIERQIGQVGNQIGEVRRMARDARKQANATTAGLPETRKKNAEILPSSQSADTAPLLRPEAAQNPTKSFEQIDEEVRGEFSPDTADLREVREFGKRETAAPEYTEEPPTGQLARKAEVAAPQTTEQTFSSRLEQGILNDAAKQAKPQKRKMTGELSPIEYLKRKTNRQGFRVTDRGEARKLGSREAGIVGLTNKKSKWSVRDAQVMLDEGGFTMPDGRAFTDPSVTEHDVLTYLDNFGKQKPVNTANLDQRLREEEAAHYAKQEEAASEPAKSFDEIASEVEGETSDTAALRRSIARSEERGHVMPEPGRGLVSMSPYADIKARNAEAVDRLYEVGPATKEGREIINNLRAFNKQNGIESRHLGNLINDVKNFQMERARWKEEGLSLDTVQQALDSETTLKDRVREATAKLPDNQRTAIEREVAALDELYDDANAMNLLDRIVEGDNNAVNEFKQKAGEYGLEPDTIAELVGARESERTVRQAEIAKARAKNERTQTPAQESREARSATPDEFDLLNRNPATIPRDEFDQHLLAVEKLRNDEIRGIVKLPRDDRRQMYKHLRNLNEERKFRVKRGELPAKYERLPVPTMEERRAMWEKGDQWNAPSAPKAREHKATESRAESDILSDAKIQFKSGKRNQPGTLYADENALHVLRAAYEEVFGSESDFKAVNLNKAASRRIAEVLQTEAKDTDYPAAVQRKLRQVAREFTMAAQSGETVSIVSTAEGRTLSEIKGDRRHELFHDAQEGMANSNDFLAKHKYGKQIIEGLSHYSFEDRTIEAAAHAAAGQGNEIGLNDQQSREFLNDYFDDVVKNNGREALERFALMSPRTQEALKQARERHGIKLQEKTARTGERVEGQRGNAVGATASTARESKRIPGSDKAKRASFGELENEPRGQVLGAFPGNLQNLFRRGKPKAASPSQQVPLPKGWNGQAWAQKFYRDAMANGLSPKERQAYDAAKTVQAKNQILLSASFDPAYEKKVLDVVDLAADATTKGDGSLLYDALVDAAKLTANKAPAGSYARTKHELSNALGLPRALMASVDVSAPLRQGAILTLPPSQWGKAAKAGVRMFEAFSTKQYDRISKEINLHPDAPVARDAGLYLSTDKSGLAKKEEDFISGWTEKIPLVKHSEQAYKTYLDSLRMDTFARYKKSIDKSKGLSAEQKEAAYKAAADWINVATGRGSLGETFESAMPVLSKLMFAPRYTASRIQVLNPKTYAKNARTAEGRAVLKNQMADLVQFSGVIASTLALAAAAGATVGLQPDDPDFLKIKFGNVRYDALAGLQQPMRLFYRMGESVYNKTTGRKGSSREDVLDIAGRFGRSKLAPVPSFFVDYLKGRTFTGEKFSLSKALLDRVVPLIWKDYYDAYQKEGHAGAMKVLPGLVGIGVQNYGEKPGTLKPTEFSKEAAKEGLKYDSVKQKTGEPDEIFKQRVERVNQWMDTYGQKLIDSPRYKSLSDEEKQAALKTLRARIGRQQNAVKPNEKSFEPSAVMLGMKKAERTRPRRDAKKLWVAPPK